MAVEGPWANQNSSYGAEITRRAVFAPYLRNGSNIGSVLGGAVGTSDCFIKTVSGMTIKVEPGELIIPGSEVASGQSGYYGRVTSAENITLAASSGSAPRIDRISAIVTDKAYSGNPDKLVVAAQTGTPKAGATLENTAGSIANAPENSFTIGIVLVPQGASSISAGNIAGTPRRASLGLPTLTMVNAGSANPVTLTYGEWAATELSTEVKLPAPAVGAECGFLRYGGTGTVLVKAASGSIFVAGRVAAATTGINVAVFQPVRFISDGGNWFLLGGVDGLINPNLAWSALTSLGFGSPVTPSTTRDCWVKVQARLEPQGGINAIAGLFVGGVKIAEYYNDKNNAQLNINDTFPVAAGEAFQVNQELGSMSKLFYATRLR